MKRTRSSCFQQIDPNHYKSLGEVTTEPRSRDGTGYMWQCPGTKKKRRTSLVYQVD